MKAEKHLINTKFVGTADLESPEHGVLFLHASVKFDPLTLEFTLHIPAAHPMVECLADEFRPLPLLLRSVRLSSEEVDVDLRADLLDLYRQNSLPEWPEHIGGLLSKGEEKDTDMRRLVLGPKDQKIEFHSARPVSEKHPCQFYYGDACSTAMQSQISHYARNRVRVNFCRDFPQKGIVCAFGGTELATIEERLHATLMLCHGRSLPPVLQVQGSVLTFFGYRSRPGLCSLPLLSARSFQLMERVLSGFLKLSEDEFRSALIALKFFIIGKQAEEALEVRYIMLMVCVESMDGVTTRQLTNATTSALLGVSSDAAFVFNGIRNKLVHGLGGYSQAFAAFLRDDVKDKVLCLEPEIQRCLPEDDSLDFPGLWLRLCERLDAFWCAYLEVPPKIAAQREALSCVPLMLPVDLDALRQAVALVQNREQRGGESVQIQEILDAKEKLEAELDKQKGQLRTQGQLIGQLKAKAQRQDAELAAFRAQLAARAAAS